MRILTLQPVAPYEGPSQLAWLGHTLLSASCRCRAVEKIRAPLSPRWSLFNRIASLHKRPLCAPTTTIALVCSTPSSRRSSYTIRLDSTCLAIILAGHLVPRTLFLWGALSVLLQIMHSTEKSRASTCSTDNGSSHGHDGTHLTHVISNESTILSSPKHKESELHSALSPNHASTLNGPANGMSRSTFSSPPRSCTLSADRAVHLNALLVTGQRKTFRFDPNDTVETVKDHIWNHWPDAWPQPKPESAAYLRLLHLGHILDDPGLTLASRNCKPGATTVVHIIIRAVPPTEPIKTEQGTSTRFEVESTYPAAS